MDAAATVPWSVYYISAHTTTPSIFFDSPPDSGYSVDNIAPGVPLGMSVAYNTGSGNELAWDPSPEPDFQYYRMRNVTVKTITDRQKWEYDEEQGRWFLQSDLPAF